MVRELIKFNTIEKRLLIALSVTLLILAGAYVYFVNRTIFNVVERKGLEQDMSMLATEVSELERTHLTLKGTITEDLASELGFRELAQVSYLTRTPVALAPLE